MSSAKLIKSPYLLPHKYNFHKVLGEGVFGCVLKCLNKDTKKTVAVKIPKRHQTNKELSMMKKFMSLNFQQRNIIKFLDTFNTPFGPALVMEKLDISMNDYIIKTDCEPMLLRDTRSIIQQTATALDALKSIGVIHTDVKLDNIMLVNHKKRPFRVKLIDFGLAMYRQKAKPGMAVQALMFRAPEIILGLPFSEAIDMWSLGIVMAAMITGCQLFSGDSEYKTLQQIVHCLGQPEDRLLNDGLRSTRFFIRTATNSWRLKTPEEYWGRKFSSYNGPGGLRSLDDLKKMHLGKKYKAEAIGRVHCIELLKAMLTIDDTQRITPSQVLIHPFIDEAPAPAPAAAPCSTKKDQPEFKQPSVSPNMDRPEAAMKTYSGLKSDFSCQTLPWSSASEDSCWGTLDADTKEIETTNIQPDHRSPSPTIPSSHVIYVQPASAENTLLLEDQESSVSLPCYPVSLPWSSASEDSCWGTLDTDPKEIETTNIQPDHHSPSPTIPSSHVIYVKPASAENTLRLEDQENAVSHQIPQGKQQTTVTENSTVTENDTMTSTPENSTTCEKTQSSQSPPPVSESSRKKRKNCYHRFFSWLKKTCSCLNRVDDDGGS